MRLNPDDPDRRTDLFGLHIGVVVNRADPDGLGRVRVRVPGVVEPASAWAWPIGAPGGGSRDRGLFWVPEEGAEVAVFFKQGDPDAPFYLPANWGAPGGTEETPEASDGGDPDVRVLALGAYDVVVDTRAATKGLRLVDKADGENVIEFDGVTRVLRISATTSVRIESTGQIDIQGLVTTIQGIVAGSGNV